MSKKTANLLLISLLILGALIMFFVAPLGRYLITGIQNWGKEPFYVKITEDGIKEKDGLRYGYRLAAYDKEGHEKILYFTASRSLRKNAYLKLYVDLSSTPTVTAWEEVKDQDIPKGLASRKLLLSSSPTPAAEAYEN
jgi:uncharacterized protein (TIGR01655 family)